MPETFSLSSKIRVPEDILCRQFDGESVLLNIQTGVYFGLDPMGTSIWSLLQKKKKLGEIFDSILKEYDVEEKPCRDDLFKFVSLLSKNELIKIE